MAPMFITVSSVMILYVETALQTYVTLSHTNTAISSSAIAMISLCSMCLSFLASSITSYVAAYSSTIIDSQTSIKQIAIFRGFHLFQFGLSWRAFRLISTSVKRQSEEHKMLTELRLVHVTVQSLPFVVIFSSSFLVEGSINSLQTVAMVTSTLSSALAITDYTLRRITNCSDASTSDSNSPHELEKISRGGYKSACASVGVFLGTVLVLSARTVSVSLVASRVRLWVFIPLGLHFVVILIVFASFSSRDYSENSRGLALIKSTLYILGMSFLNCFELVHDNIKQVMCKYVAFYSFLLIENLIFISFWLLSNDSDHIPKLVITMVLIAGFVIGSSLKLSSCSYSYRNSEICQKETEDCLHDEPVVVTTISATDSSRKLSLIPVTERKDLELDLINIVQSSLVLHSKQTRSNVNSDESTKENHITANQKLTTIERSSSKKDSTLDGVNSKPIKNSLKSKRGRSKSKTLNSLYGDFSSSDNHFPACNIEHLDKIVMRTPSSKTLRSDCVEHNHSVNSRNFSSEQNESIQHSSMLSVSDPDTLRSDMMYEKQINEDVCQFHGDSLYQFDEHYKQSRPSTQKEKRLLFNQNQLNTPKTNHPERNLNLSNHPHINIKHKKQTRQKEHLRVTNAMKRNTDQSFNRRKIEGYRGLNSNIDSIKSITNQSIADESTDNAMSSAKTYPCKSKFDKEMKTILSSIPDRQTGYASSKEYNTKDLSNPTTVRFSDSEAILRSRVSIHKKERNMSKNNMITYTDSVEEDIEQCDKNSPTLYYNKSNHTKSFSSSNSKTDTTYKQRTQNPHYPVQTQPLRRDPKPLPRSSSRVSTSNPNVMRLCESGSSSFTTTMTNGTLTPTGCTSTSTSMTTEDCWKAEPGTTSDAKSEKLSQYLQQSDTIRISPSENILRWLSTTSPPPLDNG